jgi:hypothetical protein
MEHAALEGLNGSDGARAHDPINDERALRWLHVAVEECLDKTDVVGAIEATMTDGGHNGLHLQFLSTASTERAMSGAGMLQLLLLQCLHKCILSRLSTLRGNDNSIMEALP